MGKNVARIAAGAAVLIAAIVIAFIAGRDTADDDSASPTDTPGVTATPTEAADGSTDGSSDDATDDGDSSDSTDDSDGADSGDGSDSDPTTADEPPLEPAEALPVGTNSCGIELFTLTLPRGWYHDADCKRFSREPVAEGATLTEVDLAWTLVETFDEAVERVTSTPGTWEVLAELDRTVADRQAKWLAVELGSDAGRSGFQHLVLVDLEEGVLFLAASSSAPEGASPNDFDLNSSAMETIIESLLLHARDNG